MKDTREGKVGGDVRGGGEFGLGDFGQFGVGGEFGQFGVGGE